MYIRMYICMFICILENAVVLVISKENNIGYLILFVISSRHLCICLSNLKWSFTAWQPHNAANTFFRFIRNAAMFLLWVKHLSSHRSSNNLLGYFPFMFVFRVWCSIIKCQFYWGAVSFVLIAVSRVNRIVWCYPHVPYVVCCHSLHLDKHMYNKIKRLKQKNFTQ